jgi:hypothetical protein
MSVTGFTGIRVGMMQTTELNNATPVTLTPPADADYIFLEVHAHDMRITYDGSAPTTTVGFKFNKDVTYRVDVGLGTTIRAIALSGTPSCYWQAFRVKRDDNT